MRNRRRTSQGNFAGSLLLAHPAMRDPNFRRSVVLMSLHNAEGAMGVVINRPQSRKLSELSGDFALGPLAAVPLYTGGPVQPEQLVLAAWQIRSDGFQLHFGIEPDKAQQLQESEGTQLRGFLGYSGWSAGQLEEEMRTGTWVAADVPADLLDHAQDERLWRTMLGRAGAEWRILADEPEQPDMN